jgi:hypothetical protein
MSEFSKDYDTALRQTQKFHQREKGFSGRFMVRYIEDIKQIATAHQCKSMLDYGCGRGAQYAEPLEIDGRFVSVEDYLGIHDITKYDPGYQPFAKEPSGRFDLVICTQVLGSIPVGDLPAVLDRIFSYAIRAVYIGEVLNDAPRKQLHHSLASAGKMPHGWSRDQWADQVRAAGERHPKIAAYLRTKDKRKGQPKGVKILDVFNVQGDAP